jgi:hypothetical protein
LNANRSNRLDEESSLRTKTGEGEEDENKVTHRDSNGVILEVIIEVVFQRFAQRLEYSAKQAASKK